MILCMDDLLVPMVIMQALDAMLQSAKFTSRPVVASHSMHITGVHLKSWALELY